MNLKFWSAFNKLSEDEVILKYIKCRSIKEDANHDVTFKLDTTKTKWNKVNCRTLLIVRSHSYRVKIWNLIYALWELKLHYYFVYIGMLVVIMFTFKIELPILFFTHKKGHHLYLHVFELCCIVCYFKTSWGRLCTCLVSILEAYRKYLCPYEISLGILHVTSNSTSKENIPQALININITFLSTLWKHCI